MARKAAGWAIGAGNMPGGMEHFAALPRVQLVGARVFEPIWARQVHADEHCELLHVLNGSVELVIGRRRYAAVAGDILLVPYKTAHRDAFDLSRGLQVFCVFFDWTAADRYFRLVGNDVLRSMSNPHRAEAARMLDRFRHDVAAASPADLLVACTRLHMILMLLLREALLRRRPDRVETGAPHRALMLAAKKYVEEHYTEPVALDDIAAALSVSSFHLSHIFSQESAFTLFDYLARLRMEKAKELLAGGMKIAAVAREVGYEDGSYFSKAFRRYFGAAPREFRRGRAQ